MASKQPTKQPTKQPPSDGGSANITLEQLSLDPKSTKPTESKRPASSTTRKGESLKPSVRALDKPSSSTKKGVESQKPAPSARALDVQRSLAQSSSSKAGSTIRGQETMGPPPSYRTQAANNRVTQLAGASKVQQSVLSSTGQSQRYPTEKKTNIGKTTNLTINPTYRALTQDTALGDNNRTNFEGVELRSQAVGQSKQQSKLEHMVSKNEYQGGSEKHKTYPANTQSAFRSMAPSGTRSILSPADHSMAARQSMYRSLAPSQQAEQDDWAASQFKQVGACPENFKFERKKDGYQCKGGHHFITDDLLAEGKGGIYSLESPADPYTGRAGPYYEDPQEEGVYKYCGAAPLPHFAHQRIGGGSGIIVRPNTQSLASQQRSQQQSGYGNFGGPHSHGGYLGSSM